VDWHKVGESWWRYIARREGKLSLSLSNNSLVLAVGLPFSRYGNTGIVHVHSRPADFHCDSRDSLLRVSLGTEQQDLRDNPGRLAWYVVDYESDNLLIQGTSTEFEMVTTEACVDAEQHCCIFRIFNDDGFGIVPPGVYALFLNGSILEKEPFDQGYKKVVVFGKCPSNPSSDRVLDCHGSDSLLEVYTTMEDNPGGLTWTLYDNVAGTVILEGGPYPENWGRQVKKIA